MGGMGGMPSISSSSSSESRGENRSNIGANFGDFNISTGSGSAGSGLKPLHIALIAGAALIVWLIKR